MNSGQIEFLTGPISQVQTLPNGVGVPLLSSPTSPTLGTNPTVNIVNQTLNMTGASSSSHQSTSGWENASLTTTQGITDSNQASQTDVSLEALLQQAPSSTAGATRYSTNQPSSSRPSVSGPSRPILAARPRSRKHERKRSKLSTEATPFDSVDYWMQFDTEEGLENIPEDATTSEPQTKSTQLPAHRLVNSSLPFDTAALNQTTMDPADLQDYFDDSAIENALSEEENYAGINLVDQLSKIESRPPADIPPREGLYSTPLSWERPQPGLRMDQLIGLTPPSLNAAEQARLIAIAMNPGSMGGLGSNLMNMNFGFNSGLSTPMFGSGFGTPAASSVGQATDRPQTQTLSAASSSRPAPKRQHTGNSEKGKAPILKSGDRTAHNDIERKYRTNLKDKIAELKNAVPALQTIAEDGDDEEPGQPGRAPKVSKGAVLTKATEYIHQLERKNKQILTQHQELSRRLQAFEALLAAQARPTFQVPDYSRTLFDPRAFC